MNKNDILLLAGGIGILIVYVLAINIFATMIRAPELLSSILLWAGIIGIAIGIAKLSQKKPIGVEQ